MPYLIDSPEGWFRKRQKDLYSLTYRWPENTDELPEPEQKAIQEKNRRDCLQLTAWFDANLPTTERQQLGPSEYSGWVCGGPGSIAIDFDPAGLVAFKEAWGSNDSPWELEHESIAEWQQKLNNCQLLVSPRPAPENLHWWDTPTGFIFIAIPANGDSLSRYDAAWRLTQLRPDLSGALTEDYPYGTFYAAENNRPDTVLIEYGSCRCETWSGLEYEKNHQKIELLKAALGIAGQKISVCVSD